MISHPHQRLWLYTAPDRSLEILLLGDLEMIAHPYAVLKGSAEQWDGFENVTTIAMGPTMFGIRAHLSRLSIHIDPVAEGMRWLRTTLPASFAAWQWTEPTERGGTVATW